MLNVVDEASPSSTSSFEMLDMESVPAPYKEVQPHWFFCRRAEDSTSWSPFSREDSDKLENACKTGKHVYILYMHIMYCTCTLCIKLCVCEMSENIEFSINSCEKIKCQSITVVNTGLLPTNTLYSPDRTCSP